MQPVGSSTSNAQPGCLIPVGVLFVLLSCAGALFVVPGLRGNYALTNVISAEHLDSLINGALFGLGFLGVGTLMIAVGLKDKLWRARVTPPQVAVSTQELRVGEVVTLKYQQKFRRATEVQSMRFQLILRERATHGNGTRVTTEKYDTVVQEFQVASRHFAAGEGFQEQRQFQPLGMHSFNASYNELHWLIHLEVKLAGWPAAIEEYALNVAPELAP